MRPAPARFIVSGFIGGDGVTQSTATRIIIAAFVTLVSPGCSWAQDEHGPTDDVGVWHVVQDLRAAARDHTATREVVLEAARAELALGRPARARELLAARLASESASSADLALLGAVEELSGLPAEAAELFTRAARRTTGARRGELLARAAAAYEEANLLDQAAVHYRAAAADLPVIAGWLAVREARVASDTARAFRLLRWAPAEADRLAGIARATVLLRAGDTTAAAAGYAGAGAWAPAAALAPALRDRAAARGIVYRALDASDKEAVDQALSAVTDEYPPEIAAERVAVARALRRRRGSRAAVEVARTAVAEGDSAAATLRFWGDLEAAVGRHSEALRAYKLAAAIGGADGELAEYSRARLLLRLRRREEAHRALREFADRRPAHPRAPAAMFTVADNLHDLRRVTAADSLFRVVVERWTSDEYASRARLHLATRALTRRDTAQAIGWYEAEVMERGVQRHAAQYLLGRLRAATGDSARARALWARLAEDDVAGYYGVRARQAAGLPPPAFTSVSVPRDAPTERVVRSLERLDLLRRARLLEEADEVVRHLTAAQTGDAPGAMLVLAEGLIARGWVVEGVNLGWRATGALSMRDARVLRAIYPWRFRELIESEAAKHGLDPYLLAALIRQESTFRPAVVSHAGAHGLMQLMPSTASNLARRLGVEWDDAFLHVADANVHIGAAHLANLLKQYEGDVIPALAAYNAGSRPVRRWLRYPEASDPFLFVERIPYVETRGFVRSVLRNYTLYRALYPPTEDRPADQR